MSQFLTKLNAKISNKTELSGKKIRFIRTITLENTLHYKSDLLNKIVVVPRGFVSDGASVPRAMWSIYPPFGKYLEAAVVHDWYCVLGNRGESPIDYKVAAKVFREAMAVCGVNKWRRFKMYWAVILGGPKFSAKKSE
jgi:hypothetical protein